MNILAYVHLRNIYRSTGAGRVARQLTEQLALQQGATLRILADREDHRRIVPQVGEPWSSFAYAFLENSTSWQQARWFMLHTPKSEAYWPEADIVYCTAESYVPTRRSRLVVTLHDAAYFDKGAHYADAAYYRQRLKWSMLYRTLARRADMFHTVSEFSAERLAHHFPGIRARLRVVPNAVAATLRPPSPEEQAEVLAFYGLTDTPYVLLPGGLHYRKNADLVLQAWPMLRQLRPSLRLVVINHSDPAYALRAQALDSVQLAGFVADEHLCSLYSGAEAVWFPSLYEGFGLPVLEAMVCGSPVVASNCSSLPEVAGNAAILVSPRNPDEHVEALESILASSQTRNSWIERGRERARRFTWESSARQLRAHFETLM